MSPEVEPKNELKNQQSRILPVPLRATSAVPQTEPQRRGMDLVWSDLHEALEAKKTGIAMDALGLRDGPRVEGPPPWQATIDFAKSVGLDLAAMSKDRSDEMVALRTDLSAKEREVHEMRAKEMDRMLVTVLEATKKLAEERNRPQEQPKGFLSGLDGIIAARLGEAISDKVFGDREPAHQRTLTDVIQELGDALGEDPVEIRKRLRGEGGSLKDQLAQTGDGTLRLQLTKLLLDSELEDKKAERQLEVERIRANSLGRLVDTVKENLPDFITAMADQAKNWNQRGTGSLPAPREPDPPRAFSYKCSACDEDFAVFKKAASYTCPHCGEHLEMEP